MSLEFNFYVRDRLIEYFRANELAKLEIRSFPLKYSKEEMIDIITYCSLGKTSKRYPNYSKFVPTRERGLSEIPTQDLAVVGKIIKGWGGGGR